MKKSYQIVCIGLVISIFIAIAIVVYFSEGGDMRKTHYFRIELNPKVEFLTDSDNIVNTIYPINDDAKVVVAGEDFVGLDVSDAVAKFLDLSAQLGYIDVDGLDNAVQVSVSSSFTQSLENKIYKVCNDFFVENEIFGVIAESDADRKLFEEKVEKKVSSIEKLVVIKAVMEKTQDYTFEELNSKNESKLIEILAMEHSKIQDEMDDNFVDFVYSKEEKLQNNKVKFNNHLAKIKGETKRDFLDKYNKFKKSETASWELDFQGKKLRLE